MKVGSISYMKGCHLFYVAMKLGQYYVVLKMIVDKDKLRVVTSDTCGRCMAIKILFE